MLISHLSQYLEKLEKTSSRNEITQILSRVLKETSQSEIEKTCYLVLGELLPPYRGVEFHIAEKMMIQILAKSYGEKRENVLRRYKTKGDLGDTAYELAREHRTHAKKILEVGEVYDELLSISGDGGAGSQERKIGRFAELFQNLDPLSAKYVARIPLGKLRLGFSDATLLDALSLMEVGDKSYRKKIEGAFNVTADIGAIAKKVKMHGVESLKKIEARPSIPIRPSLAERLKDIEEVIEKAGPEVGVEQKLDGFRTQIHIWEDRGKKDVTLFSRNLENTTHMFPEIVASAKKIHLESVILDGETIGFNPATGKFLQFQETVQRKRKYDIEEFAKKIPLYTFVFDVLYLNGKSLLMRPFRERRKILEHIFGKTGTIGSIKLTSQKITRDTKIISAELKESLSLGLEGLVVKNLDLPYEAGSRGFHWIKLKANSAALEGLRQKTKDSKLPDTIDCVLMGAYKGRGKRAQFGFGGFLLGVRERDRYLSISRLGTGLSDEQFREAKKRIEKVKSRDMPKEYVVDKEAIPDVWASPSIVIEILADEITLSPRHTAGRTKEDRGYSLRFPRLVRFRDDKNPEDATTVKEIEKMYNIQK